MLFYSCGNSQTAIVLEGLPPIKDTIECTTLGIVEEGVLVVKDTYTKADNEGKNRNILIKNNSFKGKIPEIGQSNKRLNIEVSNDKLKK